MNLCKTHMEESPGTLWCWGCETNRLRDLLHDREAALASIADHANTWCRESGVSGSQVSNYLHPAGREIKDAMDAAVFATQRRRSAELDEAVALLRRTAGTMQSRRHPAQGSDPAAQEIESFLAKHEASDG